MSRLRDTPRRITGRDILEGRVDPPDDYAWLRETEETSCPDCGAGEHEQDRCAERSTTP